MSKDQRGEAAIAGFSVMIILTVILSEKGPFGGFDFVDKVYGGMTLNGDHGFHGVFQGGSYDSILAKNVFLGMFAGSLVAFIYNKFNGIELPSVLGFFSGRRLVPVVSFMITLLSSLLLMVVFP